MKESRARGLGRAITLAIGPIALGFLVGLIAGQNYEDPTVTAAVLSAILAGAGGILFAFSGSLKHRQNNQNNNSIDEKTSPRVQSFGMLASVLIAIYSSALWGGTFLGATISDNAAEEKFWGRIQLHQTLVAKCTVEQARRNQQRKNIENANGGYLEPLSIHQVCPEIPSDSVNPPSRIP